MPSGGGQGAVTGYEAELWGMADALRGSMDASEYNYTTWRLAKMNLAIRGIEGQIAHGDTFHNDRHPVRGLASYAAVRTTASS